MDQAPSTRQLANLLEEAKALMAISNHKQNALFSAILVELIRGTDGASLARIQDHLEGQAIGATDPLEREGLHQALELLGQIG